MGKKIILVTGPPGAGKGTQTQILAKKNGWHFFSVGEILRSSSDSETRHLIDSGAILSAEKVVDMVTQEISRSPYGTILVDGFPRLLSQAKALDKLSESLGIESPVAVLLDIDSHVSWQRIKERGRKDDQRSSWENRWQEYERWTRPAIEYYRSEDRLIEIDGKLTIPEVSAQLEKRLNAS